MWLSDINRDIRSGLLRAVPGPVWDWMWKRKLRKEAEADEAAAVQMSYYPLERLDQITDSAHFAHVRDERLIRQVNLAWRIRKERKKQEMETGE